MCNQKTHAAQGTRQASSTRSLAFVKLSSFGLMRGCILGRLQAFGVHSLPVPETPEQGAFRLAEKDLHA